MRNIRSYLPPQDVQEVQPLSYCRLNTTVGVTYGSRYKRRYGTSRKTSTVYGEVSTATQVQALAPQVREAQLA